MSNDQKAPPHLLATDGSLTARGSLVTKASSRLMVIGLAVARVGDIVTYEDGSEARFAPVGSRLSNGGTVTDRPEREGLIAVDTFAVVKRSVATR
ncbi:hypothetical protein WJ36_22735 [Burkholderia ubonensis]|uniref:hypothetical protein n=1 Tax=Burkholderia ubonensis TaxID=101571 RepID=UPI0007536343|nr:hypothetical protein [Burkholderia ubonensis]KVG78802.1 hypothetical protein WJ36_22735 [Burkholderia ubonensis]